MQKKQIGKKTLKETIQHRKALEADLSGVKDELSSMGNVQTMVMAAGDARARLESFVSSQGNGSERSVPESLTGELNRLKENVSDTSSAAKRAKDHQAQLTMKRGDLEKELAELKTTCSKDEALTYLAAFDAAAENVAALQSRIADQENEIQTAQAKIPSLGELPLKREDILADIAIGQDLTAALSEVEENINKKTKAIATASATANKVSLQGRAAIAGLNRKLVEAEGQFAKIKTDRPEVLTRYLLGLAELAGSEYVQLAGELIGKYRQLVGLNTLLEKHAPAPFNAGIMGALSRRINIPGFALDSCEKEGVSRGDTLFSYQDLNPQEMARTEEECIRAEGVALF